MLVVLALGGTPARAQEDGAADDLMLAREVLRARLLDDDPVVVRRALMLVSEEDLPRLLPIVDEATRSKDPIVSLLASEALHRCGRGEPPARPALPPAEADLERARRDRDVPALARLAASADPTISVGAAAALRAVGEATPRPAILDRLREPDPPVRAVQAARLVPFPEDAPDLRRLLAHRDWVIRLDAALALGALRDERAFDDVKALLDDPSKGVRAAAADALGSYGTPRAGEALRSALENENLDARVRAALALARLGDFSGAATLLALAAGAADAPVPIRVRACAALASFDRGEVLPALRLALRDPDPLVALEAVDSIRRLRAR